MEDLEVVVVVVEEDLEELVAVEDREVVVEDLEEA